MKFTKFLLVLPFVTAFANAVAITNGEYKDCLVTTTADAVNGLSTSVTLNGKTLTIVLPTTSASGNNV